jgi:hypothetical protein
LPGIDPGALQVSLLQAFKEFKARMKCMRELQFGEHGLVLVKTMHCIVQRQQNYLKLRPVLSFEVISLPVSLEPPTYSQSFTELCDLHIRVLSLDRQEML